MADVEAPSEPQARRVFYCGGKSSGCELVEGGKRELMSDAVCSLPPEVSNTQKRSRGKENTEKEKERKADGPSTVNLAELLRNAKNGLNQISQISGQNYTLPVFPSPLPTSFQLSATQQPSNPASTTQLNRLTNTPITEAVTANLSTLSVSAQERAAKDAAKKEAKAAQSEARDIERKAASKIYIKRVERNKRKHVTVIMGLEVFGMENKKIAKDLGKKFATGSSMTRAPSGAEEITVQGDVSEDVKEWLLDVHGDKVPEANIEFIEDKKKKKADAAAAGV